jgi:hypothetical protein
MIYLITFLTITFERKTAEIESRSAQDAEKCFNLVHLRTDRIQGVRRKEDV